MPTSWQVFPDALSVLIQYLSLDWPADHGWAAYNGLQLLAYFVTVFVAAPLALVTGLGMSPALSTRFKRISKPLSIQAARSLHFLVLCWFLFFIVMHVTLVFTTGLLRNLNHIYAGHRRRRLARVLDVRGVDGGRRSRPGSRRRRSRCATRASVQRIGFALIGPAQRLFEHVDATPGEYSEKDISPYFWHNGAVPRLRRVPRAVRRQASPTTGCASTASSRIRSSSTLDAAARAAAPRADHAALLHPGLVGRREVGRRVDADDPRSRRAHARGEVGRCSTRSATAPTRASTTTCTRSSRCATRLTMLAYDMNGEPLTYGHGAPLRLRNEVQLGFKQVKWIARHRVRRRLRRASAAATAATTPTTSSSATASRSEA